MVMSTAPGPLSWLPLIGMLNAAENGLDTVKAAIRSSLIPPASLCRPA